MKAIDIMPVRVHSMQYHDRKERDEKKLAEEKRKQAAAKRSMQPSKCKAKFDGVGCAVNETTSTKNTEDSDHLISRDEIIIAFSECMGEPIDEIARVGGDEQQMTALVNTKVAALLGSGGSGAMENVSDMT